MTIVDNVVRAMPALLEALARLRDTDRDALAARLAAYDNDAVLAAAEAAIRGS